MARVRESRRSRCQAAGPLALAAGASGALHLLGREAPTFSAPLSAGQSVPARSSPSHQSTAVTPSRVTGLTAWACVPAAVALLAASQRRPAVSQRASTSEAATQVAEGGEIEYPLESLREVDGVPISTVPAEQLEAFRRAFPLVDVKDPNIYLINQEPPVFVMLNVLDDTECQAFIEAMRDKDGRFPERLGQSNLPPLPSWLSGVKNVFRGLPVLDWLGNPTVRWTYRSRVLLDSLVEKVRTKYGLDVERGAANIKHYRKDQWLPVHIDYNRATMLVYLNQVEEGGHTLFPTLGIKVRPIKGSCLVWPNQPPLKHGGDRVISGEKWIIFYNWPGDQNWDFEYDDIEIP